MNKTCMFRLNKWDLSDSKTLCKRYGKPKSGWNNCDEHIEVAELGQTIFCEINMLHDSNDFDGNSYLSVQIEDEVVNSFCVVKCEYVNVYGATSKFFVEKYFLRLAKHCIFLVPSTFRNGRFTLTLNVSIDKTKVPPPKLTLNQIRLKMFDPPSNEPDFNIICKDDGKKSLKFHKNYLCQFSGYFQRMLENPTLKESQKNEIEIPNCSIKTLTTFYKILYTKNCEVDGKELSPELMIFADKFDVQFLYNFIRLEGLQTKINEENAIEMYKIAESKNDQDMLKIVFEFFKGNGGKMKKTDEWKEFAMNNPDFLARFFEFTAFMDD